MSAALLDLARAVLRDRVLRPERRALAGQWHDLCGIGRHPPCTDTAAMLANISARLRLFARVKRAVARRLKHHRAPWWLR